MWRWWSRRRREIRSSKCRRRALRAIARLRVKGVAGAVVPVAFPIHGVWALVDRARHCASRKVMAPRLKLPQKLKLRRLTTQPAPITPSCWAEAWAKQPPQGADLAVAVEGVGLAEALAVKAAARGIRLAGEVDRAVVAGS